MRLSTSCLWGGKAGVNCFILITGYFLVKSSFKSRSLVKLLIETFFTRLEN